MDREERRAFVRRHRLAVFGYARRAEGPSLSLVHYVMEDSDKILVCTMAERSKAGAVARNPKVSLCVLDEQWPMSYMQVYCDAEIDTDLATTVDLLARLTEAMAGQPMDQKAMKDLEDMAIREKRLTLRLTPRETFVTPPRFIDDPNKISTTSHWTSNTMPW
jgi:PPOX class probable F420-dependent enzyme